MTNSHFLGFGLILVSTFNLGAMAPDATPAVVAGTPAVAPDYPETPATYAGRLAGACSLSRAELLHLATRPSQSRCLSAAEATKLAQITAAQRAPFHAIINENGADKVDGTPACDSRPLSRCLSTPSRAERPASAPVVPAVGHLTLLARDRGLDVVDGIPSWAAQPGSRCCSVPTTR